MAGTGTMSSVASSTAELQSQSESNLRAKSSDVGWQYAVKADPLNSDKLKCLLCNHVFSGGIYRIKQHIANIKGNVAGCKRNTDEDKVKCLEAIKGMQDKKKQRFLEEKSVREEVVSQDDDMDMEDDDVDDTRKKRKFFGSMDRFVSKIDPESSLDGKGTKSGQMLSNSIMKERAHKVDQYVARWIYQSAIPFHGIENDAFKRMVEAIGQYGPGYKPPTQYKLREPLLKEEVERTKEMLKKQEEEWKKMVALL